MQPNKYWNKRKHCAYEMGWGTFKRVQEVSVGMLILQRFSFLHPTDRPIKHTCPPPLSTWHVLALHILVLARNEKFIETKLHGWDQNSTRDNRRYINMTIELHLCRVLILPELWLPCGALIIAFEKVFWLWRNPIKSVPKQSEISKLQPL